MNKILIIDDDLSFLEIIKAQLLGNRYRVFTESSGQEGIKTANMVNPDLIICDIKMPEMDGFQVLDHIRNDTITKNIPVIMLTAVSDKESICNAMKYNINDYIVKPHTPNVLFQKIETAIKYNRIKSESALMKQGLNIDISISDDSTVIAFKNRLSDESVINEAKHTFSQFFLRSLLNKYCIIDFRSLSGFNIEDAKILILIFQLFGDRELFVVVGEHYGDIVSYIDLDEIKFDETVHFFISFGDMELFLRKMR